MNTAEELSLKFYFYLSYLEQKGYQVRMCLLYIRADRGTIDNVRYQLQNWNQSVKRFNFPVESEWNRSVVFIC